MKRREFITLLGGAAAGCPLVARAQQREPMRRIGVLMGRAADDPEGQRQTAALERGLKELGWLPGRNLEIEYRWQTNHPGERATFANELVAAKPDVLVTNSTPNLAAARNATPTIPIVFVAIADPVAQGFVDNLANPGGMITGFGVEEPAMGAKWIELLKEIAPRVRSITAIFNPHSAPFARMFLPPIEAILQTARTEFTVLPVGNESEIQEAVAAAARRPSSGITFLPDSFLASRRSFVVEAVDKHRLPAIYPDVAFARSGGLIAYGFERTDIFYRAASYVDRILKGEKPASLPVQMPTKFELAINLNSAKKLGLDIPPTLLARADEVIE